MEPTEKTQLVKTLDQEIDNTSVSERLRVLWQQSAKCEKRRNYPSTSSDLKTLILKFADQHLQGRIERKSNVSLSIKQRIAEINTQISRQLDEIIHQRKFQKLEASWKGLHFLVTSSKPSNDLKFRVLNISKSKLRRNFEQMIDFDRSILFRLVYEKEYGTFGGTPYSILIGDYEFSRKPPDLFLLQNISHVAAAAHTPFISGVDPRLLDMDSFEDLGIPKNLNRVFESNEMIKWHAFRQSEDSRYVALVLPRIILRLPYGRSRGRQLADGLYYEEDVSGIRPDKYLWGNAAYALGQRICDSFTDYGWMVRFFGVDNTGSGIVKNLPIPQFDALVIPKMSTDVFIVSSVEKELSNQGIICLCHCKMTNYAAFFSAQTVHKQKTYMRKKTNENERLSAMLPHMLTASRFAHYIKAISRDKIGRFSNKGEVTKYLNKWINRYVLTQTNVSAEMKALHPLQESKIEVFEDTKRAGYYKVLAHIKPHYQLETLNASIRLVSTLPEIKG